VGKLDSWVSAVHPAVAVLSVSPKSANDAMTSSRSPETCAGRSGVSEVAADGDTVVLVLSIIAIKSVSV